jgi:N-acetylmuramoyl-L-alanine amidase
MITLDNGVVIDESLSALGFTPGDPRLNRTFEFISIHHWGVYGQTHDGVCAFFCTTGPGQTSAGYVASDGRVNCLVADADIAWHAGTWEGNRRSIGIECHPEATDGDYATVASLVRKLREEHGDIPLVPHNYWFNTACPGDWDLVKLDKLARNITTNTPDEQFMLDLVGSV